MFQVSIDPVSSSAALNARAPARSDQSDDSDDFGALVDSNTNAAATASSAQSYSRSQAAQGDVTKPAASDSAPSQSSRPPASSQDDKAPPAQSANASANQAPAKSGNAGRGHARSDKDHQKDDDKDDSDQKKANGADSANANGAVVVQAVAQTDNAKTAADTGDGKKGAAIDGIGGVTGQTAKSASGSSQAGTAQGANGQTFVLSGDSMAQGQGLGVKTGTTNGQAAAGGETPVDANATADAKASAKLSGGKAESEQAQSQSIQDQTQTSDGKSGANADTNAKTGSGDGSESEKSKSTNVKSDATQIVGHTSSDGSTGATAQQPLSPNASFQSVLNLHQPVQQSDTSNFTVTNTGASHSAQALSAAVPLSGVAVDIATKAAAGKSSFQISLDPADLGRIDVKLDVDKHGQVTSHLVVDHPATLDMLRNDAPKLQQALENAGFKTGDGGLQFSLRDQSSQQRNDNGGQNQNAQRLIVSEDTSTVKAAVSGSYSRARSLSSGVDISI